MKLYRTVVLHEEGSEIKLMPEPGGDCLILSIKETDGDGAAESYLDYDEALQLANEIISFAELLKKNQ
jgi:hypothetical protein